MSRSYQQYCPIARTLDIVGDRWTMLIMRDLLFGTARFNDLMASSPGMPARVLADRLKNLTEHGLVDAEVYCERPVRVEYRLTAMGRAMAPTLRALARWGLDHLAYSEQARPQVEARVRRLSRARTRTERALAERG